ncbi:MAG: FHA domain-containing protein, partial [Victivallales bacterium]|nr:FHA domain-containing protein [Victivallales bacterium]
GVSRYHAKLFCDDSGIWRVQDLGSTNGVKVNQVKIATEQVLAEGDLVAIGDQIIRVSGFGDAVPQLVFGSVDGDSATPESRKTAVLANDKTVVLSAPGELPEESENPKVVSAFFSADGETLFDPKKQKDSASVAPEKMGDKPRFSGWFFYVLIGALAVIGIGAEMLMLAPASATSTPKTLPVAGEFSLLYEKSIISRDNVFRFTLLLEDEKLEFTIDDIKSHRHVSRTEKLSEDAVEIFRNRVNSSGIWNEISTPNSPGADKSQKRKVMIADGTRVKQLSYLGNYVPGSVGLLESLIGDLAENYGLQTISLTPEELRRQAEANFAKAEDYYGNREAKGSNLRDAIRRYRLVVGALEQFTPRPQLWDRARKRLEEAESLRARKLDNLEVERVRLGQIRDFDGIRNILLQTMELSDEDSRTYHTARERLFKLDSWLRGRKR